jgi:hypothetical protein
MCIPIEAGLMAHPLDSNFKPFFAELLDDPLFVLEGNLGYTSLWSLLSFADLGLSILRVSRLISWWNMFTHSSESDATWYNRPALLHMSAKAGKALRQWRGWQSLTVAKGNDTKLAFKRMLPVPVVLVLLIVFSVALHYLCSGL